MQDLTCQEITDILDEYTINYRNLNVKGNVNLAYKTININPLYNQDISTLMHEFAHIYYETCVGIHNLAEEFIEREARTKLQDTKLYKCLDDYLYKRTKKQWLK